MLNLKLCPITESCGGDNEAGLRKRKNKESGGGDDRGCRGGGKEATVKYPNHLPHPFKTHHETQPSYFKDIPWCSNNIKMKAQAKRLYGNKNVWVEMHRASTTTLPSFPSLEVDIREERDPEPPIKPPSSTGFRMKEVDHLTIHTPPSPDVASFYPKDTYCYYHSCTDDPKKHYGFKPGLLRQSRSLSLEVLRKFHWMILGGRYNQLSHASSSLLSKPGES
nr:hypothetical protein [Tanacetum cinerariifolium]